MDSQTHKDGHEGMAEAIKRLSEDLGVLVRRELEFARNEMAEKAKSAGIGAGMLSGSAIAALLTLASLTALLILAISTAVAAWLAALLVTILWAAVAAALGLAGKKKIAEASPMVPEQTIEHVKEDVRWVKDGAKPLKK